MGAACSAASRHSSPTRPRRSGRSASTSHVYIVEDAYDPGGAAITLFVDDLETASPRSAPAGSRPADRETYSNGVRKVTYRDPDGNEIGFGGPPE